MSESTTQEKQEEGEMLQEEEGRGEPEPGEKRNIMF
jgi:hypothetical protein